MRTLAIGDMHGCLQALDRLLAEVRPQADDLVVTLGDYVDRGPDSKGVIDRLIQLDRTCTLVPLRGNHDLMMLEARREWQERERWYADTLKLVEPSALPPPSLSDYEKEWLLCGGRQTLDSYSQSDERRALSAVPDEHWKFLELTCVNCYETPTHLFVHANAYPDRALAEQPEYMLFWEKVLAPRAHESGKVLICGHTAQKSGKPRNWGHTICIDTWVYGDGWLTCLDTGSGQIWQANQNGETCSSWIDAFLDE